MYLTEDNRINHINPKIPVVGFIDIPDVSENNICDVNYELRNIVIKPQPQDEHAIYIEAEYEVDCNVYEEKNINLIQDMYRPDVNLQINRIDIATICDKKSIKQSKNIQGKNKFKRHRGKEINRCRHIIINPKRNQNKLENTIRNGTKNEVYVFKSKYANFYSRRKYTI